MNYKIGKNAERNGHVFNPEQKTLWRHECKLKKEIPRLVADLLRGEDLLGKPQEIIEHDVRIFCKLHKLKFSKRLVQRALLIWLSHEMIDTLKIVLDKRGHLC